MTVEQIYNLAIKLGIENDLRGKAHMQKHIKQVKEKFEKLGSEEKKFYDKEKLNNPYPDSRVLHDSGKPVKKVMVGIDISGSELLLAKEMGDIDLVISHHPMGVGLADLTEVMHLQAEVLADYGVPINIAQSLLKPRIDEVARGVNAANHQRVVDFAKLLDISLICTHTVADNMVGNFLKKKMGQKKFEYVSEILKFLKSIPEYEQATKQGAGPTLFAGSPDNYAGKIALTELTGGTEGSSNIYAHMSAAGIGTVIGMHMSEKHTEEARKSHINAIIAGHISSDSIGMNLFLDNLEKKKIKIVPCGGLIRVSRNNKR